MKKLIGLSLSACVADIINYGEIKPEMVEVIISGTRIVSEADLDYVIARYQETFWSKNPQAGDELARRFWREKKIIQPRVGGHRPLPLNEGCWKVWDDQDILDDVTKILTDWRAS